MKQSYSGIRSTRRTVFFAAAALFFGVIVATFVHSRLAFAAGCASPDALQCIRLDLFAPTAPQTCSSGVQAWKLYNANYSRCIVATTQAYRSSDGGSSWQLFGEPQSKFVEPANFGFLSCESVPQWAGGWKSRWTITAAQYGNTHCP
jgi:hypothetical protein